VTREQAASRVAKLEALAQPGRGGSPAERASAGRKARELTERYGLHRAPRAASPRSGRPVAPGSRGARRGPRRERVFVGGVSGAAWAFDVTTGKGSANVKVRSYQNRSNWKIEVEL
jgi:hypothetical protein